MIHHSFNIDHLLVNFLSAYNRLTDSPIPLISNVNNHVHSSHGKQLRPLMTMLSACCCGFPIDAPADHPIFEIAAAIETLHASTLIHDDVVDNSNTRRGKPSVNNIWGNKVAVLMGDFYLAKVMQTLNKIDNKEITAIINDTVILMSEGELIQQQQFGKYTHNTDIYLDIISRKTASFMAACCKVGAAFATQDKQLQDKAWHFGNLIGIAFQMRDDILDYMPSSLTGKPQGNDLREGKCTLPLILALQNSDAHTKNIILSLLNGTQAESAIEKLIDIISSGGHLQSASHVLQNYLSQARNTLLSLPHNNYRDALYEITEKLSGTQTETSTVSFSSSPAVQNMKI